MKKTTCLLALICSMQIANAQTSWELGLNNITPGSSPNFGTSSGDPINFFTNNTQRMSLNTQGVLNINGLAGTGNRFLQVNSSGNLVAWTGSGMYANSILFGDGSWRPNLITVDGNNMFIPSGAKFGIGKSNPGFELDVDGNIATTGHVQATNGLLFNSDDGLTYNPGSNIISLGKGSNNSPPPVADPCAALPSPSALGWLQANSFGFVSSQANIPGSLVNAALRMYTSPSNGNGFIEVHGVDGTNAPNNALYLNYNCGRKTHINTGSAGGYVYIGSSSGASKVFIGDFINMNKHVEIGDPISGINNSPTNVALDINTNSGLGLRFKTNVDNIPLISIEDNSNSILKPTFTLLGDGATVINTENQDAFEVKDFNNPNVGFKVYNYGQTVISPANGAFGLIVKDPLNNAGGFVVNGSGYTQIKSSNTKALSIYNGANETVSINKDGYTEINVFSPAGMPIANGTFPRVITVRDKAANKDIFSVMSSGKVYAREVEINLAVNFPDYVFKKGYNLKSIEELAAFIDKNQHLPGFEKGEYYEKNGINVNNMFIKQQEKIEELTLYIIELEKRLNLVETNKH